MKGRGTLLAAVVAVVVAALAPTAAQAQQGGNVPQYVAANAVNHCGPYGTFFSAYDQATDSAGNVTNAGVCTQIENTSYVAVGGPGTSACGAGSAGVAFSNTSGLLPGAYAAGYYIQSHAAHYIVAQYFWN
jgi:hypothetical protein